MLAAIPEEFLSAGCEATATRAQFLQFSLRKDLWRCGRYRGHNAKGL
jgi:hypothetical protein